MQPTQAPPPPTPAQQKEQLELEKLRLEVGELKLSWWKRPVYLGLAIPIVLALLTFLTALLTGWFDEKREQLEDQKKILTLEVHELRRERDQLRTGVENLFAESEKLNAPFARLEPLIQETRKALAEAERKGEPLTPELSRRVIHLATEVFKLKDEMLRLQQDFNKRFQRHTLDSERSPGKGSAPHG